MVVLGFQAHAGGVEQGERLPLDVLFAFGVEGPPGARVSRGRGCTRCSGCGYRWRSVALFRLKAAHLGGDTWDRSATCLTVQLSTKLSSLAPSSRRRIVDCSRQHSGPLLQASPICICRNVRPRPTGSVREKQWHLPMAFAKVTIEAKLGSVLKRPPSTADVRSSDRPATLGPAHALCPRSPAYDTNRHRQAWTTWEPDPKPNDRPVGPVPRGMTASVSRPCPRAGLRRPEDGVGAVDRDLDGGWLRPLCCQAEVVPRHRTPACLVSSSPHSL